MKSMLAISFIDLHIEGGLYFMLPLTILLLSNLSIILYSIFAVMQKKIIAPKWLEAIKQIGVLAAVFGAFGTIVGLFAAFDALESIKEMLPFQVIMGGMKVAVITVIYGLSILCLSMLAYIILKLSIKNPIL
jgi:MotA/TolQ/ExbB proton channel family